MFDNGHNVSWDTMPPVEGLDLSERDDVLVVGIDFGTTFSGVAYATRSELQDNHISLITEWPACGNEEGKAPTELFYEHGTISWGYDVPQDADPVRWFKLLLLKNEDVQEEVRSSEFYLRAKEKLRIEGRRPVELVADYLRLLWEHTQQMIEKSRGPGSLDSLRFHIVITVPAIWKGYARQSMEEAAKLAGLLAPRPIGKTRLSFVLEPEAAGMATLVEPENKRLAQPGDTWLICDAGGGTVDLISYAISSTDPITMKEAVEGTGGLCGGVLIDDAFQGLCRKRLGRRWTLLSANGIKEILTDKWERGYKRQFYPKDDPDQEYPVPIPAEAFDKTGSDDMSQPPYIKKGRIHFRESDIATAYTESFSRIDALVDEQIQRVKQKNLNVKGIILVGGLGSSPYLYRHLKQRHAKAGILVLQSAGMKPRTAICRGAVHKGFLEDQLMAAESDDANWESMKIARRNASAPIRVTSTISRYSLGTSYYKMFDPTKDDENDPYYDWESDEGDYVIRHQVAWYIIKGEDVSTIEPVKKGWNVKLPRDTKGKLATDLVHCDSSNPPDRRDDTVKDLCELKCTLVDKSALKNFTTADGKKRLKSLDFDLEMVPSGASMDFVFYVNDRKQGSNNVTVEYE